MTNNFALERFNISSFSHFDSVNINSKFEVIVKDRKQLILLEKDRVLQIGISGTHDKLRGFRAS